MLGATILAGIAALSIASCKGKLGINLKKLSNKKSLHKEPILPKTDLKISKKSLSKAENTPPLKPQKSEITKNEPLNVSKTQDKEKILNRIVSENETASDINYIDWNTPLEFKKVVFGGNYVYYEKLIEDLHTRKSVYKLLKELENTTFDTPNLQIIKDYYNKTNFFDLGLRYAIIANNTANKNGFGGIIHEVPKMFKGIEIKELFTKLDDLAALVNPKKINKFNICGREYTAELIGGGCLSDVYKITYPKTGEKVCIKFARQPYLTGRGQGIFDEVAIALEANKAGVVDIPKFYMANPIGRYKTEQNGFNVNHGAWQIIEFVEENRPVPSDGLRLLKWLDNKGLYHGDCHNGNFVGDVIVDLGGIIDKEGTIKKFSDIDPLLKVYQNQMTTSDILKECAETFKA